jgi:hypothetical protein
MRREKRRIFGKGSSGIRTYPFGIVFTDRTDEKTQEGKQHGENKATNHF